MGQNSSKLSTYKIIGVDLKKHLISIKNRSHLKLFSKFNPSAKPNRHKNNKK